MSKPSDLIHGTLDLLILNTISLQPQHGWAIAKRIQQVSQEVLQVSQGALYPALHRLEQQGWIRSECRDMRRTNQLETIWNDLRYAVRALGRTPGFAVVIVLTLALAIGANSAIFSVIQGVLLRPLPYTQPDRIVRIFFNSDTFAKFP